MQIKIKSILGLILILGLHSCSPKLQSYTAEVNFLYKEAQGTIAVKSTGYDEASSKHSAYFKKFFDEGNYKTFMMSSTESSNLINMKGTKKITVDVKINYNSLRKDLEQNQLIRKFGY